VTSLDPQKLVISANAATAGQASITARLDQPIYLQGLSGAAPGDKVMVRLEAPDYQRSEREVVFAAAELQTREGPLEIQPGTERTYQLVYGPVEGDGLVSSGFNGGMRPGVSIPVRIASSDESVVSVTTSSVPLDRWMAVRLQGRRPGKAQLLVDAPAPVTNRVPSIDATVRPYDFYGYLMDRTVRYLISSITIPNPRSEPTTVTLTSIGQVPVRFGTSASGAGVPSGTSLTVAAPANQQLTVYYELAGSGTRAQIRLSAPEFANKEIDVFPEEPQLLFSPAGPMILSASTPSASVALYLAANGNLEKPLGSGFGRLPIRLSSSNPQVVRVPSDPVEFAPGDSRKTFPLQVVGRGEAVITVTLPAGFSASIRPLIVSVQ